MGGLGERETAELYEEGWEGLGDGTRRALIYVLNVHESVAEPAIQPTNMPAMITQGFDASGTGSREDKIRRPQGNTAVSYSSHNLERMAKSPSLRGASCALSGTSSRTGSFTKIPVS